VQEVVGKHWQLVMNHSMWHRCRGGEKVFVFCDGVHICNVKKLRVLLVFFYHCNEAHIISHPFSLSVSLY
jgi:hypothetical protein